MGPTLKQPSSSMTGSMNSKSVSCKIESTWFLCFLYSFTSRVSNLLSLLSFIPTQNFSIPSQDPKVNELHDSGLWIAERESRRAYLINIALFSFTVQINAGRVDISLKKEDPHKQWESIGTFLAGHGVSTSKNRRGVCVCVCVSINGCSHHV